jgi:hypothetical protein
MTTYWEHLNVVFLNWLDGLSGAFEYFSLTQQLIEVFDYCSFDLTQWPMEGVQILLF